MRAIYALAAVVTSCLLTFTSSGPGFSAERGLSSYLPAYYGDYAVAVSPKSGFFGYSTYYRYGANLSTPSANFNLNANALIAGFQFVAPEKIAGLTFATGAYSAFIDANLRGTILGPMGGTKVHQHKSQLGDTSISPIIIYWSSGNWHFNLYEAVFFPTGRFETADALNLSRNYYSLDTVSSITWLDLPNGLEFSFVPGLMYNFKNPTTNYKTGIELHLDAMLNFYLLKTFAVGFHGYYYSQICDDELNGEPIEYVDSRSIAGGVSFLWLPTEIGLDGKVVGKWLRDIYTHDRFQGDIISVTAAVRF